MRILIFHGFLLQGTGSNVYNARLAKALVDLGHDVHLLCQDRHPERAPFVDIAGDWDGGTLALRRLSSRPLRPGSCTLYRPNIGELLPVYVQDAYEGMQARTFALCSEKEVHRYLDANVEAVQEVAAISRPDIALANHLVMGPAILARALGGEVPYAVKVHGSALEYTVKPQPERFLTYAQEGLAQAEGVLVGSRHTAQSLWQALGSQWVGEHDLIRRTWLGPPGVDVEEFVPRSPEQAHAGLRRLANALGPPRKATAASAADAFARDESQTAAALSSVERGEGPIVVYVGKLIVNKGVDLLLAAWPLVLRKAPEARLVVVGFGALQQGLEELWQALAAGRLDAARRLAAAGRALEAGPRAPLRHLAAFLDALEGDRVHDYLTAAATHGDQVIFTGRLEHHELAELLPACEAIVVPSTFPEAFGMVAVEAAACGVLPISAAHSGLAEVSDALASVLSEQVAKLLRFPIDDHAVEAIASRVVGWLACDAGERARTGEAIVAEVRRLWSWQGVAKGVIAVAQGRGDRLPAP